MSLWNRFSTKHSTQLSIHNMKIKKFKNVQKRGRFIYLQLWILSWSNWYVEIECNIIWSDRKSIRHEIIVWYSKSNNSMNAIWLSDKAMKNVDTSDSNNHYILQSSWIDVIKSTIRILYHKHNCQTIINKDYTWKAIMLINQMMWSCHYKPWCFLGFCNYN